MLVVHTKYGLVSPNGGARNSDHQTAGKGFGLVSCRNCDTGTVHLERHGKAAKAKGRKR